MSCCNRTECHSLIAESDAALQSGNKQPHQHKGNDNKDNHHRNKQGYSVHIRGSLYDNIRRIIIA
jgi:hypothetical protein